MNKKLVNCLDELYTKVKNKEQLKEELIIPLCILARTDGKIAKEEVEFINSYFDENYTIETVQNVDAKLNNTISVLNELIDKDNDRFFNDTKITESDSEAYLDVLEVLCKEFLVSDGVASSDEIVCFTMMINKLRKYKSSRCSFGVSVKSSISTIDVFSGEKMSVSKNENKKKKDEEEQTLEELLQELEDLVGLEGVKGEVNSLINLNQINELRKQRGLKEMPISNHLVFYGNPGTGKTTVARLLAKIFHALGILSKGQLIEVDRSGLVAGYVGQTALKTQEVIDSALGGILFIDEAYTLVSGNQSGNDYGQEAIDILLKAMEDNRDNLIVIVAGYTEPMAKFIDSNPGLRSRFNKYINFEDYDLFELCKIFNLVCEKNGFKITKDAFNYVMQVFKEKVDNKADNFANAREVRNFFERAILMQANRIHGIKDITNEQLCTIELEDVENI